MPQLNVTGAALEYLGAGYGEPLVLVHEEQNARLFGNHAPHYERPPRPLSLALIVGGSEF